MTTLHALWITPAARAWLAGTRGAQVLNVFDRACNLVNPAGEVLALVTSERGLTPFGLVVDGSAGLPFGAVSVESPVRVAPGTLQIGPVHIDHGAARGWDPRPDWEALRLAGAFAPARLAGLAALVEALGRPGSLLDLIVPPPGGTPLPPGLLGRARAGAADLIGGLAAGHAERASLGAARLAGLGGGLTPAGDDFAVGVCLAAAAGVFGPQAPGLCRGVAAVIAAGTTALSAAYVMAAARGECAQPWHQLFQALAGPAAAAGALAAPVKTLLSVGHTSGADALAGFVLSIRRNP